MFIFFVSEKKVDHSYSHHRQIPICQFNYPVSFLYIDCPKSFKFVELAYDTFEVLYTFP